MKNFFINVLISVLFATTVTAQDFTNLKPGDKQEINGISIRFIAANGEDSR